MIEVDRVDLGALGVVLPNDHVGVIIAQPFLELSASEPPRCKAEFKSRQLSIIADTLALARANPHGATKTHFTLFPEYTIPGLEGVALIEQELAKETWPTGTVVLGGTDGLSKAEYATLTEAPRSHINQARNGSAQIGNSEWVNCAIIWVKAADGTLNRWLQPKLHPAWDELDIDYQSMFCGSAIFSFRGPFANGTFFRFSALICFDWISVISERRAWQWPLEDLYQQANDAAAEIQLSWFFVLQHNPRPSHHTFLTQVERFFDQTYLPNVRRDQSCLIFANTAGKPQPGKVKDHGGTSLIFTRQTSFSDPEAFPTFSNGGQRYRQTTMLLPFRDIFFREGGACVHSFIQVNPRSLVAGPAGREFALKRAYVFPLYGIQDPRAPSDVVPSCIKWLNDELDEVESLASNYAAAALSNAVSITEAKSIADLRQILAPEVAAAIAAAAGDAHEKNPDKWQDRERHALKHLVHTLSILGTAYPIELEGAAPAHATIMVDGVTIDLLAVNGRSHENCLTHSDALPPRPRRQRIVVSRDSDNTKWNRRFGSIMEVGSAKVGEDRKITEPSSGRIHVSYNELLDAFCRSQNVDELERATHDSLTT